MTLDELRLKINQLDDHLLALLSERMDVVRQVGELKRSTNAVIYRPEREKQILDRLKALNQGLLPDAAIDAIFLEIFAVSRNIEMPERIAYLGPNGSFTHQAAESRFGAMSEYMPVSTIQAVFNAVSAEVVRFGVVPVENNQQGLVPETADCLATYDVRIAAELPMDVHFTFVSKADKLSQVKKIYSKDIAFRQCSKFINEVIDNTVELIPVESTSKAARLAATEPNSAAICSRIAAQDYQVPILLRECRDVGR